MEDLSSLIAVIFAAATLLVAILSYRNRHKSKYLEYVVVSRSQLVPHSALTTKLSVLVDGNPVEKATVTVVRIVSTGNGAIRKDDFQTKMRVRMIDVMGVAAAVMTGSRPKHLEPNLTTDEDSVLVEPLLINPGDMLELSVISSGMPKSVTLDGRLADVAFKARQELPYPPGTGNEGVLDRFDRFMWYGVPVVLAAILGYSVLASESLNLIEKVSWVGGFAVIALIINPMHVRWLVKRRALWRPDEHA